MKNIAKTVKGAIFVLAFAAIVSCNNSDDINEIFIGHDWILTYIENGGIRRWSSHENAYSLTFGANSFNATTPGGGRISGRWHANGATREFRCPYRRYWRQRYNSKAYGTDIQRSDIL